MDYIPVRTLAGNPIYLLSAILAHNLARELQMIAEPPQGRLTLTLGLNDTVKATLSHYLGALGYQS
jgi:hypothetical protein